MTSIIFLIERVAIGLFILIGLALVWNLYKLFTERSEYRSTYFELERDLSRRRQVNSLTAIIILIQIGIIVMGIQQVVAPTLSEEIELSDLLTANPRETPFATPTPQPVSASGPGIDPVPIGGDEQITGPQPTPTLTPTPVGTILPNAPQTSGCISDNAFLQIPTNGMRVFNAIEVVGSAHIDNFGSAKLEVKSLETNVYQVVGDQRNPVNTVSPFSQFNPQPYDEGWYEFRLSVFDITGEMRAHCMVNIYITAPFPTATPIGEGG